jgi:hypothetical protein
VQIDCNYFTLISSTGGDWQLLAQRHPLGEFHLDRLASDDLSQGGIKADLHRFLLPTHR